MFLAFLVVVGFAIERIVVDKATRFFQEKDSGRVRLFHGVNYVEKSPPYYPAVLLDDEEIQRIVDHGFTAIRLGRLWKGVEPTRGSFNASYEAAIEAIVEKLGKAGVYTIADAHQDCYAASVCGEGMPDWSSRPPSDSLPFPLPSSFGTAKRDANGDVTNCGDLFSAWELACLTDASSSSYQSLYTNVDGLRDSFAAQWVLAAKRLRAQPAVLGYELINEPFVARYLRHPSLLLPGVTDRELLQPFYKQLVRSIRSIDNETLIFFEPTTYDYTPCGFEAGAAIGDVLSWHDYCLKPPSKVNGSWFVCDATQEDMFFMRDLDAQRLKVGAFLTEFGVLRQPRDAAYLEDIDKLLRLADEHLMSWTFWEQYSNANISLRLQRPYARAIAGVPLLQAFSDRVYSFSFVQNASIAAPTEVWAPRVLFGVQPKVSVAPLMAATVKRSGDLVYLTALIGGRVDIKITR